MSSQAAYRVLYTRPEPAHAFEARLRSAGCALLRIPLIRIAAPASWDALDAALARLASYDGIILTSVQAARWFSGRLIDCGIEEPSLPPVHVVGPKTAAAAKDIGLAVEQLPSASYGATLAAEMKDVEGKRYLQPTSDIARDELVRVLAERGARVEQVAAYRTLPATDDEIRRLRVAAEEGFDCVAFFSPSAVRQFRAALTDWQQGATRVAVIGDTTADEAERTGLRVDIIAAEQTAESLAESIARAMHDR
ncbi:MAG: uroporphyrinogen-III synthase [Bacteroidota bacterium]|nr:uroporphyrinogen-III synthase [Bacteroidota bacterium]